MFVRQPYSSHHRPQSQDAAHWEADVENIAKSQFTPWKYLRLTPIPKILHPDHILGVFLLGLYASNFQSCFSCLIILLPSMCTAARSVIAEHILVTG